MEELKKIDENILIEFRQRYIGPFIKKYGNMLRVCDCPESGLANRVGSIDLRLMNEHTAVHCDPIVWNEGETPETAALQIVNALFSTLQFSVKTEYLTDAHKKMIRNYMEFMREHKALLQESAVTAEEPQNLYPEVSVRDDETEIIALYSTGRVVTIGSQQKDSIIVNGTRAEEIYVRTEKETAARVVQIDCFGTVVKEEKMVLSGITSIPCTTAGRIEIKKEK